MVIAVFRLGLKDKKRVLQKVNKRVPLFYMCIKEQMHFIIFRLGLDGSKTKFTGATQASLNVSYLG